MKDFIRKLGIIVFLFPMLLLLMSRYAGAQALPGGTQDPALIPKYVTPLVIPPVMKTTGTDNVYDIAIRQFKQQILPADFPATTVWSYGPAADPLPAVSAPDPTTQFNYPAYTIETTSGTPVSVRWRNELVENPIACAASASPSTDPACNFLPHLLPVDQTLHWANPPAAGCTDGTNTTDCRTANPMPYTGPVPLVTHVHGAHVDPHSDGYPEAWWLPKANNIPAGYAVNGRLFDDAGGQAQGLNLGYADYVYRNDQPASTIWYHDHALGMTRLNVYAGPAGFWLIRGGAYDLVTGLPGPAPEAGQGVGPLNTPGDQVRNSIREIPLGIQDRSFNSDGSLFYPSSRSFFDGYPGPYIPTSDISPIWTPEAFFNTMVVNGKTWPVLEVAPALYRFRILNGCSSRMLNLSLFEVSPGNVLGAEHPFYQIGAEQGFLRYVVAVQTGFSKVYDGTPGGITVNAPDPSSALLMGNAERADVIVDFRGLPNGTVIRMVNTGPDAPFGGFPVVPADNGSTGQVMQFVVNATPADEGGPFGASPTDPVLDNGTAPNPNAATDPALLVLPAEADLPAATVSRNVSLNELDSGQVCVDAQGAVLQVFPANDPAFATACANLGGAPFGPMAAMVGIVDLSMPGMAMGVPLMWTDMSGKSTPLPVTLQNGLAATVPVTENPQIVAGAAPVEQWNIYNFTMDAHPIHLHLVRFQVVNRQTMPGMATTPFPQQPWETGYKDTVIAYPGEITTVRAKFDIEGLYVWHCHIIEHEDNEMMRPFIVSASATATHAISGMVTLGGAGLKDVTLTLSGDSNATATTDSMGMYWFTGLPDGSYTVTPSRAGYSFTPPSSTVTLSGADVTGVNFAAMAVTTTTSADLPTTTTTAQSSTTTSAVSTTTTAVTTTSIVPAVYSISGTVRSGGVGFEGVTVTLSGAAGATATTNRQGAYVFSGLNNGAYTVTPGLAGYTFTPPNAQVTINNDNATGIDFSAAAVVSTTTTAITTTTSAATTTTISSTTTSAATTTMEPTTTIHPTTTTTAAVPATYSICGAVKCGGTGLEGVLIALSGDSGATTTTDARGNFCFTGLANGCYTVTPSLSGYTFSPPTAKVTVTCADVTAIDFIAKKLAPATFSISGMVKAAGKKGLSKLSGVTMTLSGDASATTMTDAGGNYCFTGLGKGRYAVTPSLGDYKFAPNVRKSIKIKEESVTNVNFIASKGLLAIVLDMIGHYL